jgi:hypothetical protein
MIKSTAIVGTRIAATFTFPSGGTSGSGGVVIAEVRVLISVAESDSGSLDVGAGV